MSSKVEFSLPRSRISSWSCKAVIVIICLGLVADVLLTLYAGETTTKILTRISLATDNSIPTFIASLLLLSCAALLALTAKVEQQKRKQKTWPWWFLSAVFVLLAMDEVAMLHELSGQVLERLVPAIQTFGPIFHYAWTAIAIPLLIGLAVLLAPWLFALPPPTRLLFIGSAVLFVSGAVGIEMVNSVISAQTTGRSLAYSLMTVIEEALEFAGVLLFQFALLKNLGESRFDLNIVLR